MTTHFDEWIEEQFAQGPFTALIFLVDIDGDGVELAASSYVHVIGGEIDWMAMHQMLRSAPQTWNGAAFFVSRHEGGEVPDELVRARLREMKTKLDNDRIELNSAGFFDALGRRLQIEEIRTTH